MEELLPFCLLHHFQSAQILPMLCCFVMKCSGGLTSGISHTYSNRSNFHFQSSFSFQSFLLRAFLFPTFLSFYFLSYALSTPQATALCFLGTKRKARNTVKGVPTAFSATWSLEWEAQHKALLSHCVPWNVRGCVRKRGIYRAFWTVPSVQSHERQKFGSMV